MEMQENGTSAKEAYSHGMKLATKCHEPGKGLIEIGVFVGICACDEDERKTIFNKV